MRPFFLFLTFLFGLFAKPLYAFDIDNIVGNLQRTYQTASDWQADFSQSTYVDLLGKNIEKSGHVSIKKPGKLRIQYKGEVGRLYVSNGKKLVIATPGDSQVETYNTSQVLAKEALAFLQGLGNLRKEFSVTSVTSQEAKKWGNEKSHLTLLKLTPLKKSIFQKIILGADPKNYHVREMTLINTSGNTTHYIFYGIRFNSGLSDDLFEYKM